MRPINAALGIALAVALTGCGHTVAGTAVAAPTGPGISVPDPFTSSAPAPGPSSAPAEPTAMPGSTPRNTTHSIEYYLTDACRLLDGQLADLASRVHVGTRTTLMKASDPVGSACLVQGGQNRVNVGLVAQTIDDLRRSAPGFTPAPTMQGHAAFSAHGKHQGQCLLAIDLGQVSAAVGLDARPGSAEYADACGAARQVGDVVIEMIET